MKTERIMSYQQSKPLAAGELDCVSGGNFVPPDKTMRTLQPTNSGGCFDFSSDTDW